ncbi:MAG: AAA family ATPase [Nitrospirae bacterium]|nr:AAA family ATPase [Nitrospirota bacterium]
MIRYRSLMNPAAYPHPVREVRHLATHISDVFLTGPFAYKIKKPVDLKFLDFSTLEKRRHFCEREVILNSRLAPEIYLGVVPITRDGEDYHVEGKGEPVEYAVKMVQFGQEGLLDAMAGRGALSREIILRLADQTARFHLTVDRADAFGTPEVVGENVLRNFEQTAKYQGLVVSPLRFSRLKDYSEDFLKRKTSLFHQRIKRDAIRVCHGDLHLQNICLDHGRLIIFDCIEFNEALNHIDVMSEVAFLLMDMDHRGHSGLGNRFLNAYLEKTQDYEGLAMLDFYLIYRACVRAKVACFLLEDPDITEEEKKAAKERASAYFELAGNYLGDHRPGLILISGVSGSGKSTVAADLAEELGGVMARSDAVRKSIAELGHEAQASADYGRGIYSQEMTARTYDGLLERAGAVIASGRWAILDATYAQRQHRLSARSWAEKQGAPFGILYCTAPLSVLETRLAQRTAAGTDVSDADIEIMRRQLAVFEPFDREEAEYLVQVDTEKRWDREALVKACRKRASSH